MIGEYLQEFAELLGGDDRKDGFKAPLSAAAAIEARSQAGTRRVPPTNVEEAAGLKKMIADNAIDEPKMTVV